MIEMYERLKRDRKMAWERSLLFAKFSSKLEVALQTIRDCPCCEQFSCSEFADKTLAEVNEWFQVEWVKYKEKYADAE